MKKEPHVSAADIIAMSAAFLIDGVYAATLSRYVIVTRLLAAHRGWVIDCAQSPCSKKRPRDTADICG